MKNKGWIIFGIFIIAAIIAFAIYKVISTPSAPPVISGGSTTTSNPGILSVLNPIKTFIDSFMDDDE